MDYCSSCRRHLNGALVCPGCGAYAPDIAPSAAGGSAASDIPGAAATGTAAWEPPADDTWYDGYFRDEAAPVVTPADVNGAEGIPADAAGVEGVVPAAPQGRAARRRQRARWKKNQRRAVVATAVALVGGGLTVSALDRGSTDKAQAATAPENPNTMGAGQEATELTRPASTPPATDRSSRTGTTPPSQLSPTNEARRESVPDKHTSRQVTRPDAATTPGPTAASVPPAQSQSVSTSGGTNSDDSGGTAAEQQQTPTPTATDSSDSGTSTSTSETSPAPEETSPAQLCVLNVVCVG